MHGVVGLCVVLALIGAPVVASDHFKDVPADHWAAGSVEKLAEAGIVKGYPDSTFRGDQPVTRYELASAMARFIEYMRESAKPLVDVKKQEPKPESRKPGADPVAFLKSGGFLTEDSPLLQKDTTKPVTIDQLAQTLATVAAKLVEERVPAPVDAETPGR